MNIKFLRFSYRRLLCTDIFQKSWFYSSSKAYCCSNVNKFISISEDLKTGTAVLKLHRPPVNSLNLPMLEEITAAIKYFEEKSLKGFILSSELPSIFSAGLDIKEMIDVENDRFCNYWKSFQEMWRTLYQTPLATVAAINGHAPAAGCLLALSCDFRIVIDHGASLGVTGTKLGITCPRWFRSLLISQIGYRKTEKALILATLFSPQEALELNLIDELVSSQEDLWQKSYYYLHEMLKISDIARIKTKTQMRKDIIDELNICGEKEMQTMLNVLQKEQTQILLKKYIESLKTKSNR